MFIIILFKSLLILSIYIMKVLITTIDIYDQYYKLGGEIINGELKLSFQC